MQNENSKLKAENQKLHDELADVDRRLQWWRSHFPDLKIPGSEKELEALRMELGRGKPACQPGNNLLADIRVVEGRISLRLRTPAPDLRETTAKRGLPNLEPGQMLTSDKEIEKFLKAIADYRRMTEGELTECRFDYQLIWATYEDYYARERFDKYLYAAKRTRTGRTLDQQVNR